jgi:hypothetical protein
MLVRVVTRHFVAGLLIKEGVCVKAAPILKRSCLGKPADVLREEFKRKGWSATVCR